MPLKVIRRPYQDCAYRWALSTSGISVGEGDCSEAQCDELNGSFTLDFAACDSKAGKLVWAGDCESQGARCGAGSSVAVGYRCNELRYAMNVPAYGTEPYASEYTGDFIMSGIGCGVRYDNHCVDVNYDQWQYAGCDLKSNRKTAIGNYYGVCTASYVLAGRSVPIWSIGYSPIYYHLAIASCSSIRLVGDGAVFLYSVNTGYFSDPTGLFTGFGYYLGDGYRLGDATLVFTKWITVGEDSPCLQSLPGTITLTRLDDAEEDSTGPETNDRIRSKWHLSYDIDAQLWTLRSFERIDYPVYTLSDASPCDGETKTLLLSDKGSSADGCGVAPAEVTITRECPPDRVGKSALLEDRKPNGATGKRKRQCGCDCLDEVDDRRQCATKCTSTEDEGCGNINPAPDDITCRYPEAINCCANTAGKDVPCAYTVEFECDLFFDDGESVRHKIAAKQVTLRRECYFEDPCLFVAPGPESSTGGSPVMDTDGFPGAQPVCSSCADLCLTGCTWDAWTVAACPDVVGDCYPRCDLCWTVPIGEIQVNGVVAFTGDTITLVPVGGVPSSNYSVYGPAAAEAGYEIYVQIKVTGCEVSAIIDITSNVDECPTRPTRPYPVHYQFRYGDNGGIGACNPQAIGECNDLTVITIVSCGNDGPDCGSLITGTAPLSLTFTKVDCP